MVTQGAGDDAAALQVKALRGLVKQQQLGADQQQLCQRKQLALSAREVVRVARLQAVQSQLRRTLPRQVLVISAGRGPFHQLVAHRLGNQQCFGILRQQRRRGRSAHHAAALQLGGLRQHREHRRLTASVAAHDRMHRTGRKRNVEPAQHPTARAIVAKPAFRQGGSRPAVHFLEYSASIRAREGFRAVLERRLRHKFGRFVQF